MARRPTADKLRDIHVEALERFEVCVDVERDQRDAAIEDIEFSQVAGSQWDDAVIQQRKGRPCLEVNKVALPINQYVGDFRQNQMTIKCRPAGGEATRETAETLNGLIRHILTQSQFDVIQGNAAKEQATGGIGAYQLKTQFAADDTFETEIRVKKICSAASSVYYDTGATQENKQDAEFMFVQQWMPRETFKARWPKAKIEAINDSRSRTSRHSSNWFDADEKIRIAEYWVREPVTQTLLLMSNDETYVKEEIGDVLDELAAGGFDAETGEPIEPVWVVDSRKVQRYSVKFYLISGAEIIEGPEEWAGQSIPVIPQFGFSQWIDGKHYYRGMVRMARDPQRIYNFLSSQRAEISATAPKDVFWATTKQAAGHQQDWELVNVQNKPVLLYEPDEKAPGPPARSGAPAVQMELASQIQQADHDIQSTTGKFAPSLGENQGDQSGRAIHALERAGEAGTFELLSNSAGALEELGRQLVYMIPKIYDTPRMVRILGVDGSEDFVPINTKVFDEEKRTWHVLNDLSVGKYDVTVDVGPSFATQRSEALAVLTRLGENNPDLEMLIADLKAQNVDFEHSDELKKRIRRIQLQRGLIEPNEEEQEELAARQQKAAQEQSQQPTPEQMVFAAEMDKRELDNDLTRAKIETEKATADAKRADAAKTLAEIQGEKVDAAATARDENVAVHVSSEELAAMAHNLEQILSNDAPPDDFAGNGAGQGMPPGMA